MLRKALFHRDTCAGGEGVFLLRFAGVALDERQRRDALLHEGGDVAVGLLRF